MQFSKIGKVMRHIAALPQDKVPRDDDYHFRTRAKALVDKWHTILGASKSGDGGEGGGNPAAAAPNGAATAEVSMEVSDAKASSSPTQNAYAAGTEGEAVATGVAEVSMSTA